jgi:sugar (pentulose or hexulose) kinase
MEYDPDLAKEMDLISLSQSTDMAADSIQAFDPAAYRSPEEGYYHLMAKLVLLQKKSTGYVLGNSDRKTIFVDGGFSRNSIYMNLIALVFYGFKVYAATVAQASAIGAAMAIHRSWNDTNFDENLIRLKYYLPGSSS